MSFDKESPEMLLLLGTIKKYIFIHKMTVRHYSFSLILGWFVVLFISCSGKSKQTDKGNYSHPISIKDKFEDKKMVNNKNFPFIDSLRTLFMVSDTIKHTYDDRDSIDHVADLNNKISDMLEGILCDKEFTANHLDSLLNVSGLKVVHSNDRKIWIFNWYENTGGSFRSNISMVYCVVSPGKSYISYDSRNGSEVGNLFSSAGAGFSEIYKLRSKKKDIYLCLGSGIGCTTCYFVTASVIELKKDSVNFRYEAFSLAKDDVTTYGENNKSCLTFGARIGNIEDFTFNPKTQTLRIAYLTDDNTPIIREEGEKQRRIVRKLIFNGNRFIGNPFE